MPISNGSMQKRLQSDIADPMAPETYVANRRVEIKTIKSWMATCISQHGTSGCNTHRWNTFPGRLIEINAETGGARLVNVQSLDQVPEFVALSYCWGLTGNLKTLKATMSQMQKCIPWDALPLTVKQAFEVAKALEFRYLWVDALCIVQDDEADWQREARKMGAVYANATLVIAALASRGTEEGLYSRTSDISLADDIFHSVMRACRTMPRKQWEEFIQKDLPLLCRGWGFQERLLARRIVHFTPAELVWEC
ncbi:heterokaryon incompatibility protein-domain-containing protein, partial [Thelonectria olida]